MLSEIHFKIIEELTSKNYTLSEINEITGCAEDVICAIAEQKGLELLNDISSN